MRINRLRIVGFKSFVEATDIPVETGLTGIVGPNGCGKSNLVESLRFVMGENSYKSMRGSAMDDVIFGGSGTRPMRNSAEVSLFAELEDEPRPPGIAADQGVEISRRIERDTGSIYRLNGKDVRARDVQLLFADAATGANSSALIRQGQIGEIIAAKPTARRSILEEAAGISGLHSRRHEAELKLRAAETNLERLDDVMSEIRTQLDLLKRQARQAVRYRNISSDVRKAEAALYLVRWESADEKLTQAQTALTAAVAQLAEATKVQGESARLEAISGARLPDLRDKVAEAGAALQRLKVAAEQIEKDARIHQQRCDEVQAQLVQTQGDIAHESEILTDGKAALGRLVSEEQSLVQEIEGSSQTADDMASAVQDSLAEVTKQETALSEVSETLAAIRAQKASGQRALTDATTRLQRQADVKDRLTRELESAEVQASQDDLLLAARSSLAKAQEELAEFEDRLQSSEANLIEARSREAKAREPVDEISKGVAALAAEADALTKLLRADDQGDFAPVVNSLEVDAGYETALAVALGEDLEASLDEAADRRWSSRASTSGTGTSLPSGATPLSAFVRGPQALARRLDQIGVVSIEAGERLSSELACGQRLVSQSGQLWRWDGFQIKAGAKTRAAQRLEQKNRIAVLKTDLELAERQRNEAQDRFASSVTERQQAETAEAESRSTLRTARRTVDGLLQALGDAERNAGRKAEKVATLKASLDQLTADMNEAEAAKAAAETTLVKIADSSQLEEQRTVLSKAVDEARQEAAKVSASAAAMAGETARRQARIEEIRAESARWQSRAEKADERVSVLTTRRDLLAEDVKGLDDAPKNFDAERRRLIGAIEAAEIVLKEANDDTSRVEAEHREAVDAAKAGLEALSLARENRARDAERAAGAQQRIEEITAQISDLFSCDPSGLPEIAQIKAEAARPTLEAVEARIERLKRERERLGGVNLRAEEEANDLDERLTGLTTEREDLEEAIKQLRLAIQSLNREARQRLLSAFDRVNGHFQALFTRLFGGGTAELLLTESDDPLEAGLEIMARPPGKKPQIMTLLSGGEQALTALSLVFAVFLTNPSPICVLDEVDAPLDDANVGRFCVLLDDMREKTDTRFLVVTHNPITMARMDRLVGVTMAEKGVSQLVTVDLQFAQSLRETA